MSQLHNAGPWIVGDSGLIKLLDGRIVGKVATRRFPSGKRDRKAQIALEKAVANARLIAAAPQMYKVLLLVSMTEGLPANLKLPVSSVLRDVLGRPAIKKARGES